MTASESSAQRPRLILIDGYSNIFRAFYAIRSLSNSKGFPTNAVYGFIAMLRKLLKEENPDLIGVAFDVSGPTVRDELFAEYKANRSPMPEDLKPQIPWVRRALEAYRIPIVELAGYEADDVLGTLSKKAAEAGYEVTVISADKDLMQMVEAHVSIFHTGRNKLYDPQLVEEDFGVPPSKIIDVMALKGDSVDNVPGVPGIGDKGARTLIREYGSLDELLERSSEISRKSYREGLEQHRDKALLSRELVTLHTDLPIDFDEALFRHEEADAEALAEIFSELEFSTFLRELRAEGQGAAGQGVDGQGTGESGGATVAPALVASDSDDWRARTEGLAGEIHVARLGVEEPLGLAVGGTEGEVVMADFRTPGLAAAARETLESWAADDSTLLVGHDLKEDLRLLDGEPEVAAQLFDTLVASFVVRPGLRATKLEELAFDRFQFTAISAEEAGWTAGQEPPRGSDGLSAYAGERVELCRRLTAELRAELADGPLAEVYQQIEAPLIPVLLRMEETGILLDGALLEALSAELSDEVVELESSIYSLAGERFNLNSPKQLGEILFERMGCPVIRKTRKTKSYSTNADVLQELSSRGYEIADLLLQYRELTKLKSTYLDALPQLVADDGRIHTRFHQAGAATGRLSSTRPNLQNIPVRSAYGQRIREAFVAPAERLLLVADYSQIELRVLAHIASEEALIAAFEAGEDIHSSTAAAVFGGSPALVSSEQRRAAKVINFGILYGMSAFGLARNLKIGRPEADEFIKAYLKRYPAVQRYMEETVEEAQRTGRVETLYGRIRPLPDINSRNHNLRENARRMAINARIQGTAADLLKKAMIAVDARLRTELPASRLLLTVHDELVVEVPAEAAEAAGSLVREEMEGVEKLAVPLVVDVGWGPSWYAAKA